MQAYYLRLLTLLFLAASAPPLLAQSTVREMSTDRPDITESAYSVAPGMFQVEMSFFDFERDRSGLDRTDSWIYGQVNFKYGIAADTDLQLVCDTHSVSRSTGSAGREVLSGFGDVTLRLKQNLWGNDEGNTAFSIMPFVSIPTGTEASADAWAGGVVLPFAATLTERLSLGLMAQADIVPDADMGGHDLEFLTSAALGISLTERWGAYTEIIISAGEDAAAQVRTAGGLTYAVTDDLVLDAGIRIGLNHAAPDLGVFTGMSFRF
jgi:hypothetical protein